MRGPIYLVGLMASGKSTVGRLLARRLGRRFSDLDAEVARIHRASVAALFQRHGEQGFRAREARALALLSKDPGRVIATGGGAVLRAASRRRLKRGLCIYLRLRPSSIVARLGARELASRPLLRGQKPLSVLRSLARERGPLYRDCATLTVDAGRSRWAVVRDLERRLKRLGAP